MNISDITNLAKSADYSGVGTKESQQEAKVKEAFQAIFVEQMIGQLMQTGNLISGVNGLQKELLEEQMKQSLSQYFMDGAGIRWNEILGLSQAEGKEGQQEESGEKPLAQPGDGLRTEQKEGNNGSEG